jgi:4'-phosphopantetheinyl transferase
LTQRLEISPLDGIPTALIDGDLHLWSADIKRLTVEERSNFKSLFKFLSAEEQARALRYRQKTAAEQFVMVRALLRVLLGQYLHQDPTSLEFCYSVNGKPALNRRSCEETLRFNLSHSQGRVLYAFTNSNEIGVDIEALNPAVNYIKLAHRICTAQERLMFDQLPPTEQCAAFFRLWTRKEAVIKLYADRLYKKLSVIDVPIQAELDECWIEVENRAIWIQNLDFCADFAGAIALPKRLKRIYSEIVKLSQLSLTRFLE